MMNAVATLTDAWDRTNSVLDTALKCDCSSHNNHVIVLVFRDDADSMRLDDGKGGHFI